jgi:hypothetical protein
MLDVSRRYLFNELMTQDTRNGVKAITLKDDDQDREYGHRIGKVILLKPFEKPPTARILALITNERPGGAYQVTMQITGLQPKQ